MDSWEIFNKTSLPDRNELYSSLNLKAITNEDYEHAKGVWKGIKLKNLGDYRDLYVQINALLTADVFENFHNKSIEIYKLDLSHFLSLSAPGLAQKA